VAGGSISRKWRVLPISALPNFRFTKHDASQNTMGSPMYPPGTNHFNPNSPLFKSEQRKFFAFSLFYFWTLYLCALFFVDITSYFQFSQNFNLLNFLPLKGTSIVVSNIGLSIMACFLFYMGRDFFLWYYLIPYLVSCAYHILIIVRIS